MTSRVLQHLPFLISAARKKKPAAEADAGMRAEHSQPGVNSSTGLASGECPQCRGTARPLFPRGADSIDISISIFARHYESVNIFLAQLFQVCKSGKTNAHPRATCLVRLQSIFRDKFR